MARFADELQNRSGELARTVSQENGMPIGLSEAFEGGFAIGLLRYYADLAATTPREDLRACPPPPSLGRPPKQDDGQPPKQRLSRLVGLVYGLAVGPGLVLNKPPFRLSVVGPFARHNMNAYRLFARSGQCADERSHG
jgi:hypothetical protein